MTIWAEANRLRYRAPVGVLTSDMRAELSRRYPELLQFLQTTSDLLETNAPPMLRLPRDRQFSLSFAQERLWFFDRFVPGSAAHNLFSGLQVFGLLDARALEKTLGEITRRHEILRTTFTMVNDRPVQVIHPGSFTEMVTINLESLAESERAEEIGRLAQEKANEPFVLAKGPLLRVGLLELSKENHVILFGMHHIISDGWSMGIFIRELRELYQAFLEGKPSPLAEIPIQYADYAQWQRDWLTGNVLERHREYWRRQLTGAVELLELPLDRPRPSVQTFRSATQGFALGRTLSEGLKAMSQQEGSTLFMALLAAFKVLLFRCTGQTDIVVGSPIANRNRKEIEGLIGFFVNPLVLRSDLSGDPTFSEFLKKVRAETLGAYAHQDFPFEKLLEDLRPERDASYSPVFQVVFVLQNMPIETLKLPGLTFKPVLGGNQNTTADLRLVVMETQQGLIGELEYNAHLFNDSTISRMCAHFQTLLECVVVNYSRKLSELSILTAEERENILVKWNSTAPLPFDDRCVHELFEEQAKQRATAKAIIQGEQALSFEELNRRANRLAHHLRGLGVGPDVTVGICLEKSVEMMAGILGIMKAGGAYVPLDPGYPRERLRFMLEDAGITVLVTDLDLADRLQLQSPIVVYIEQVEGSEANIDSGVAPEHLAYIIYTSGSTGRPKGVMIEHRGLNNLVRAQIEGFGIRSTSRVLQFASISFDASASEIFTTWLAGAALYLARKSELIPGPNLIDFLREREISVVTLPASVLAVLAETELPALQTVVSAGEACSAEIVSRWARGRKFINAYGPTEVTVCAAQGVCKETDAKPRIGRPLWNMEVFILDGNMNPVPVGVVAEFYVGGVGLARGYNGRPELTAERFIPHPYSSAGGRRLYKTGDRGRYHADGNIEFLGRVDHQVKIRGFRIELSEIEVVLAAQGSVKEAVVIVREEQGNKRLVAFVVLKEMSATTNGDLRNYLKERMPEYMVPAAVSVLEKLPLAPTGKVDRQALASLEEAPTTEVDATSTPRTTAEELLVGIWTRVLKMEKVGIHESFFELGGHSLLAAQVTSQIREVFGIEFPIQELFISPTIKEIAGMLERFRGKEWDIVAPPLVAAERGFPLPLSFAQERLWILDQLNPGSAAYNVQTVVRVNGPLNLVALSEAISEIQRRHEVLRTTFAMGESGPVQVVHANQTITPLVIDLEGLTPKQRETETRRQTKREMRRPFNLELGPLVRVAVLQFGATEHVIIYTLHHIVSDGWSMGILQREVGLFYHAFSEGRRPLLKELPIQYSDYAVWQRQWLRGKVLEEQFNYWKEQLGGGLSAFRLPPDQKQSPSKSRSGRVQRFTFGKELSGRLKAFSRQEVVSLFMVLLAAFKGLLYRHANQPNAVVGTDFANRNRFEVEELIGFFINQLVLRTDLTGNPTLGETLQRVRNTCLAAYAHHDLPFDRLVATLNPDRETDDSPLFQMKLVLQNTSEMMEESKTPEREPADSEIRDVTAKFDLLLNIVDGPERLTGAVEYKISLYSDAAIRLFISDFEMTLGIFIARPEARLNDLDKLLEVARQQRNVEKEKEAKEFNRRKLRRLALRRTENARA